LSYEKVSGFSVCAAGKSWFADSGPEPVPAGNFKVPVPEDLPVAHDNWVSRPAATSPASIAPSIDAFCFAVCSVRPYCPWVTDA